MLLPVGKTPAFLGHAVALLVYKDFARFHQAKNKLRTLAGTVRAGALTGPLEREPWAAFRYVRVGGDTPYADDKFSTLKDTIVFPSFKKRQANWPEALMGGKLDQQGMAHAQAIAAELDKPDDSTLVISRDYFSQSIDTAALEPDNANCWWDPARQELHMVVHMQSPLEVVESTTQMLGKSRFKPSELFVHPCYTVGYGSKDHYTFPFYGAMVAFYGDGLPVRLANDRFEHPIVRGKVFYPPVQRNNAGVTYYAAIATIAEVAVDTASGQIELLEHHSVLECGNQIVPPLVSGQIQGGIAMGIGHALHEYLPLYEDGPGNGTWNVNRYQLPRASDVAEWKQGAEVLPALSMIAIVPAIVNAVAHAIGHRFTELPVTAEKIREVLQ